MSLEERMHREEISALSGEELVERFLRTRDEQAFRELVSQNFPIVMGVCRRVLGNETDAEDAFQATFIILARKASQIHRRESVSSWLYGVAFPRVWPVRYHKGHV